MRTVTVPGLTAERLGLSPEKIEETEEKLDGIGKLYDPQPDINTGKTRQADNNNIPEGFNFMTMVLKSRLAKIFYS